MEFGSDEEFEKRGLADPDASKDNPENEAKKETMKKGVAKVVRREQMMKTLGAGKEGKVTQTGLLPATSGPVITRPTRFNWPGFRTPNRFFMISSTWIFLG